MDLKRGSAAIEFMLGLDLSYTLGSFSLSAPQTTERRIRDEEGSAETPEQAMKWVWISTVKMGGYTLIPSLIAGSWWPLIGGLVAMGDMHASYRYAIACGKRSPTPGGKMVAGWVGTPDTPDSEVAWAARNQGASFRHPRP